MEIPRSCWFREVCVPTSEVASWELVMDHWSQPPSLPHYTLLASSALHQHGAASGSCCGRREELRGVGGLVAQGRAS